jgi:hypothetical protein
MIKVTEKELFEFLQTKKPSSKPVLVTEFFNWVRKKTGCNEDDSIKLVFKKTNNREKEVLNMS